MRLGQLDYEFSRLIDHRQTARTLYFALRLRDRRSLLPNALHPQTDEAERLWFTADANLNSYVDLHRLRAAAP